MPLSTWMAAGACGQRFWPALLHAVNCPALLMTGTRPAATASGSEPGGRPFSTWISGLGPSASRSATPSVEMRDEEDVAAFGNQRRRHLARAEPVAVGLDDAGAAHAAELRLQPPVVLADSAEIDGQDRAGRRFADRLQAGFRR